MEREEACQRAHGRGRADTRGEPDKADKARPTDEMCARARNALGVLIRVDAIALYSGPGLLEVDDVGGACRSEGTGRQLEQAIVGEKDAARPQHPGHVGGRERLLEHAVIEQYVGGDDEIELLRG